MGESIGDFADKVGETAASNSSNPGLAVSVSFGRFENDSLSWEKWSTFSPNKYLEEVEKFATPGSVAQKRAYFEAHYKRIAARNAGELLEQEKQMQDDPFRSDDRNGGGQMDSWTHFEIDLSNSQSNALGNSQETNLGNEISSPHVDDLKEDDAVTIECQSSLTERKKEETDSRLAGPDLNKPEELVLVKELEHIPADSQEIQEIPKTLDNDIGKAPEVKEKKEEKTRLDIPKGSQKVTLVSKEGNVTNVKKKSVSPITKTPQKSSPIVSKSISTSTPRVPKAISTSTPGVSKPLSTSTPRVSKSISTSTATPASGSSVKKSNSSSLPRIKNPFTEESKKVPPKSLHMSLNLDPTSSESASVTTTRKSFIMEKMGDKDIVKRAFKTFQNNYNQTKSSSEGKSSTPLQISTQGKESSVSTSVLLPKQNGGSLEKRTAKPAPLSFGLRSDEIADKRKEFSKTLEAKSNTKEAERTHFQPKSKDQREAEIKKLRKSHNLKTTPTPGFYRGQKMSKSTAEKESSKNETPR